MINLMLNFTLRRKKGRNDRRKVVHKAQSLLPMFANYVKKLGKPVGASRKSH